MRHVSLLLGIAIVACGTAPSDGSAEDILDGRCEGERGKPRILVFSRENLWMHPSTPVAQQALLDMCRTRGFSVIASRSPQAFDAHLREVDVAVFAVTSGLVLDTDERRGRFEQWLRDGHGLVGIHSASATEYEWPFFMEALGGTFRGHYPGLVPGELSSTDPTHPITAGYPRLERRTDEWYSFWEHPDQRAGTHVLLTLNEATMPADLSEDLKMGVHPIAWTHEGYGGRTFYLALGHTPESYEAPAFLDVIARGIEYAAGVGN